MAMMRKFILVEVRVWNKGNFFRCCVVSRSFLGFDEGFGIRDRALLGSIYKNRKQKSQGLVCLLSRSSIFFYTRKLATTTSLSLRVDSAESHVCKPWLWIRVFCVKKFQHCNKIDIQKA
jgi:hypothetical protein